MELLFIVWGFVLGTAITYIVYVLKPYEKDKIKYFVKRGFIDALIEVNLTTKKTRIICFEDDFIAYGLNPNDYKDMREKELREVTIKID